MKHVISDCLNKNVGEVMNFLFSSRGASTKEHGTKGGFIVTCASACLTHARGKAKRSILLSPTQCSHRDRSSQILLLAGLAGASSLISHLSRLCTDRPNHLPKMSFVKVADTRVSRLHCVVRLEASADSTAALQVVLEDHSSNGTYVDDVIVGHGEVVALKDGSKVSLVRSVSPWLERCFTFWEGIKAPLLYSCTGLPGPTAPACCSSGTWPYPYLPGCGVAPQSTVGCST